MTWGREFEVLASQFHRETGLLAPGKDLPPSSGGTDAQYDERLCAWVDWLARRFGSLDEQPLPDADLT